MNASTATTNRPDWAEQMIGAYVQFPETAGDRMTYKLVDVEGATAFRRFPQFVISPVLHTESHKRLIVSLEAWDRMISVGVL